MLSDYRRLYFDQTTYNEWSAETDTKGLDFNALRNQKSLNGFIFSQSKDKEIEVVKDQKVEKILINIYSNDKEKIQASHSLAKFVNRKLNEKYLQVANDSLQKIESVLGDESIANLYEISNFVSFAEKNDGVYAVAPPTTSTKISPNSALIIMLSVTLGLLTGMLICFLQFVLEKRSKL